VSNKKTTGKSTGFVILQFLMEGYYWEDTTAYMNEEQPWQYCDTAVTAPEIHNMPVCHRLT
jgi:hypothetical protein